MTGMCDDSEEMSHLHHTNPKSLDPFVRHLHFINYINVIEVILNASNEEPVGSP
jgi:hypothetical protein